MDPLAGASELDSIRPLADRACVPCRGGVPPLTSEQIAPLLAQLDQGWHVEDGKKLVKRYKMRNFVQAVDFVNRITPIAEAEGHHPDLYVRWGEVKVFQWTHAIDGLTPSDFYLAAKLDRAFQSWSAEQPPRPAKKVI
jgi:4a-hydroxytetrahydrobiopterin dehydratase